MTTTRRFGKITSEDLGKFSTGDLLTIYNELADTPVPDFKSHAEALRAVIHLTTKPEEKPVRLRITPSKPISLPIRFSPQKGYKKGTKLARLFEVLSRGATMKECRAIIGTNLRHYLVTVIHRQKGYGLEERDGKLYLLTERSTQ